MGLRESVRGGLLDAVAASTRLELAPDADEADLIVVDVCSYAAMDPLVNRRALPLVVLSLLAADRGPSGSFAAEVAARESAVVETAERWCVLRCAAFGEELAWNTRYAMDGQLPTAWQPEGAPWVGVADVVELIGELASLPDRWNAAYDVTGPATVPMREACDLLHGLYGRSLLYVRLDEDVFASSMEQAGFAPVFAARRAGYMVWTTSEQCRSVSPVLAQALGRPPTPLSDYLVRYARYSLDAAG
ncbi:hypothetical protein [Streptomonospora salina]|uniref:Uncharacterized protein n=1 Tax=Streptomonospora salina TaxID=104205 RepID=A0A841E5T7_9ACTN|nr:hypothetical protein [Streptomonospora salina]MBB5998376.1 hypothetical protein [Streptomonospora salina]